MRKFAVVLILVSGVAGLAGTARADDADDQAYAAGQFTGAVSVCGVARKDANALAKKMLDAIGVDSSGPNPQMTKFTAGVTAGAKEQRDTPQASCDEVKQGFEAMKTKFN